MEKRSHSSTTTDLIDPGEVSALIRYASERGLDKEGKILGGVARALSAYTAARAEGAAPDRVDAATQDVLKEYSQLAALTCPVNGHTLQDTDRIVHHLRWILVFTGIFLILAVADKILALWFADIPEPEEDLPLVFLNLQRYVLGYLSPFIWGGLGSCVYLLKTLSDKAADHSFDHRQLQGWGARIMLGAVLGAVLQYVYNPESFTTQSLKLDASAVAFLTGVGVKVVYGAIEKTIDMLATKMNLAAVRSASTRGGTAAAKRAQE
jgi:hypothetical protein